MSNEEQKSLIQSSDERYNTHTLGQALELRYASTVQNSTSVYNNVRLLKKIDQDKKFSLGVLVRNDLHEGNNKVTISSV